MIPVFSELATEICHYQRNCFRAATKNTTQKFFSVILALNVKPTQRFRDDKFHLPTDYNARNARNRNENIINVNGDQHMDMIVEQMERVQYDKYHKPNPGTNLEVSVNMFIDTIQGII